MIALRAPARWQALLGSLAFWFLGIAAASAQTVCAPAAEAGVERCVNGLSAAAISRMFEAQEASNWCWAASVAMVLRRYGVAVPQEQIVRTALGSPRNERASGAAMAQVVQRDWHDADGNSLVAAAQPLAPWHRAFGIAAPEVIRDLAEGKPLLLGARQHAMVLVQVTYERRLDGIALTPVGVRLLRALVLDPASGQWLRSLEAGERQPDFVTRVAVDVRPPGRALALAQAAPLQ